MNKKTPTQLLLLSLLLTACTQDSGPLYEPEPIHRSASMQGVPQQPEIAASTSSYPWDRRFSSVHPHITKEFFRCKGCGTHLLRVFGDEIYVDCEGGHHHSLPIRDGEEEIYPILLELLNFLQDVSGCRVVVTCGHRCPKHNTYADESVFNQTSKHMIGAEVDFFLEGMESQPERIIAWIQQFYRDQPGYNNWRRYEKSNTNVATPPWYNKEVFIKLFMANEGRDLDNDHAHPYICIQVRHDRYRNRAVAYTWREATYGYAR